MGEKKEKPKSPRDLFMEKIEPLAPGQALVFRLPEMYGTDLIQVEAKPDYTGKGHRFAVFASPPVDGKPGPTRNTIWETSKTKAIADWLVMRSAQQFS
jgi:hypothetical protein